MPNMFILITRKVGNPFLFTYHQIILAYGVEVRYFFIRFRSIFWTFSCRLQMLVQLIRKSQPWPVPSLLKFHKYITICSQKSVSLYYVL
jgi:hypothetical protein